MLSLPDFRAKQILFIESQQLKEIAFHNENLTIKQAGKVVQRVPFQKIFTIFVRGNCTLTSVFIQKCIKYGICLLLLQKNFSVYTVIGWETEGNFLLREKQYTRGNDLGQAKWLIQNKMANQIALLKKIRKKTAREKAAIKMLQTLQSKITKVANPKALLGLEGNAAKVFFAVYFRDFNWYARAPRTKCDPINVLLDLGYTYLFYFIDAHLRLYGFDTYKGFYHTAFYQRKSLTCDLVEPLRCLIDQALRKAHHLGQFDPQDFQMCKNQFQLKKGQGKKYTKIFLAVIMHHKAEIFLYLQSYYRKIMKGENDFPRFTI